MYPKRNPEFWKVVGRTKPNIKPSTYVLGDLKDPESRITKMWKVIPKELKKMNIPPPGSFDPDNAHNGIMWGWPVECNMTDKKAKRILFKCYETKRVTANQLKNIRKTLAYAYELKGGSCKKNWPSIKGLFKEALNLKTLPKTQL